MATNPEMWMELYGEATPEKINEDGIYFPTNPEDFAMILEQFKEEGWNV